MKKAWLARPLGRLTALVLRAPILVILTSILLAAVSLAAGVRGLGFRGSRLDLLNPRAAYNQRWLNYLDEFGDQEDILVVVEGAEAAQIPPVVERIVASLYQHPTLSHSVFYKRDLSKVRGKALHLLDVGQLRDLERLLQQFQPLLEGGANQLNVVQLLRRASERVSLRSGSATAAGRWASAELRWISSFSNCLLEALSDRAGYRSPWESSAAGIGELDRRLGSGYLRTADGRLGFIILRIPTEAGQSVSADELQTLREIVRQAAKQFPAVSIGVTGMPILESDEMHVSQQDTVWASLLSLIGVAGVFVAGFGSFRRPLLTVAVLLLGLSWTIGYITVAVGHLNILSVAFGMILIGLGVDSGIHYTTHYTQQLATHDDPSSALVATAINVGPGIVTSGLTTSLAFSTAALTDFTGIAELGVIAAGGVILCGLAAILVLPAMIMVSESRRRQLVARPPLPLAFPLQRLASMPRLTVVASLLLTGASGLGLATLRYDQNLLNLQPEGLESVELERRLAERTNRGVWFALSIADSREQLLAREAKFSRLPEVGGTEEIASWLPIPSREKRAIIARIQQRLSRLPRAAPRIAAARSRELRQLFEQLAELGILSPAQRQAAVYADQLPAEEYRQRVSRFQQRALSELLELLRLVRGMAEATPATLDDLPAPLRQRFIGRSGRHLLRVYGKGDIWENESLQQFVRAVESVDPQVTGHPIQTYYASRQMYRSYLHAAVYALLAVAIVLMIDFRRLRCALLAMVPLGLGMLQMFGLLGWLGIPLNPANLIVLPLILGIGIDDGVHVLHDFIRRPNRCYQVSNSTAAAVVITSATTMIGFGSMMFASHRGLRSLGQVLTLGILCCLLSTLVVLPQLLRSLSAAFSAAELADKLQDSMVLESSNPEFEDDETASKTEEGKSRPASGEQQSAEGQT